MENACVIIQNPLTLAMLCLAIEKLAYVLNSIAIASRTNWSES